MGLVLKLMIIILTWVVLILLQDVPYKPQEFHVTTRKCEPDAGPDIVEICERQKLSYIYIFFFIFVSFLFSLTGNTYLEQVAWWKRQRSSSDSACLLSMWTATKIAFILWRYLYVVSKHSLSFVRFRRILQLSFSSLDFD